MYQYPANSTPEITRDQAQASRPQTQPYYQPAPQPYQIPVSPYAVPPALQPQVQGNGRAVAGLVLGIIGMIAWLLPIAGLPVAITGLVLATKARQSSVQRGMATAGFVLCIIALVLSAVNSILGVLIAMH